MSSKAQTGGILTIISGGIGVLGSLLGFASIPMVRTILTDPEFQDPNMTLNDIELVIDFTTALIVSLSITGLLMGLFAIIAGVFTLRRKYWGLGLAGAIVSVIPPLFFPTGVAAIIFTALAKPEFEPQTPVGFVPPVVTPAASTDSTPPPAEPPAQPPV